MFISGSVAPAQIDASVEMTIRIRLFCLEYESTRCNSISLNRRFEVSSYNE